MAYLAQTKEAGKIWLYILNFFLFFHRRAGDCSRLRYIAKRILNWQRIKSRYEREERSEEGKGGDGKQVRVRANLLSTVFLAEKNPDTIGQKIYHPEKNLGENHRLRSHNYFIDSSLPLNFLIT